MIFIDRKCPACHGEGCAECHGTGMIGGVSGEYHVPKIPKPTEFSCTMRIWRLKNGCTFRELSTETGILPGTLSEIECGRRKPTEDQRIKIEEVMQWKTLRKK